MDATCSACGYTKPDIAMSAKGSKTHPLCKSCWNQGHSAQHANNRKKMNVAYRKRILQICVARGCQSPAQGTGYCRFHRERGLAGMGLGITTVCPTCNRYANASGYCPVHDPRKETA